MVRLYVCRRRGSDVPDFKRIAFQYYDRVAGRWQYVSIDTRFPVGIMPARSFGPEDGRLGRQWLAVVYEYTRRR